MVFEFVLLSLDLHIVLSFICAEGLLDELKSHLGSNHAYASLDDNADWGKFHDYSRQLQPC